MKSIGFSSFRQLMDDWDNQLIKEANEDKLGAILDGLGILLFFEKDGEIFGGGEDSRVIFAKLKNPDDDLPVGWEDEANFSAYNLSKIVKGEPAQHVFSKDDLKKIKIIDREKAMEKLDIGDVDVQFTRDTPQPEKDPAQAMNFIQAKEKN